MKKIEERAFMAYLFGIITYPSLAWGQAIIIDHNSIDFSLTPESSESSDWIPDSGRSGK